MWQKFLFGAWAALVLAQAQTTATPPSFEVASIKAAEPLSAERMMAGQQRITVNVDAARVDFADVSLAELIRAAYRVRLYQISGPDWITTTRFDVVAKLPEGARSEQVPEMLQTLLAERFHLVLHNASKEMPVYALVIGKDGLKLKESSPDNAPDAAAAPAGGRGISPMSMDGPNGSARMSAGQNGLHVDLKNMTLPSMIDWLSRFTDRPVVDMTDLKARYDLGLDVSRDEMMNAARGAGMAIDAGGGGGRGGRGGNAASEPEGDSLATSLQKAGLKLEARRLPLTILVVDRMDKTPTEN